MGLFFFIRTWLVIIIIIIIIIITVKLKHNVSVKTIHGCLKYQYSVQWVCKSAIFLCKCQYELQQLLSDREAIKVRLMPYVKTPSLHNILLLYSTN